MVKADATLRACAAAVKAARNFSKPTRPSRLAFSTAEEADMPKRRTKKNLQSGIAAQREGWALVAEADATGAISGKIPPGDPREPEAFAIPDRAEAKLERFHERLWQKRAESEADIKLLHVQTETAVPPSPAVEKLPDRKPHAPGIYFDLPMAHYHADPSLSASDVRALLVHPAHYWRRSYMNPDRVDDTDSPAKKMGRALHTLVLEGERAFEKAFIEEPQPANFPDALVTAEDLRNYCKRRVLKGVGTTKAEMAKAIKKDDPSVQIWDDIKALFDAMVLRDGLEVLKPDAMAEVRAAAANITLNPHLARAFKGGAPEVSVFWVDDDGLPCKARHDYVKPKALINLKKFANARERPVDVAIHLAIAEYRYDLQARHYLDSYPHLYAAAQEGRVFGPCPLPKGWETQLAAPEAITYSWIFHQMDGPPVTVGRQIRPQSPALNRARREIAEAKAIYRRCLDRFGTAMWVADEPIEELADTDLPAWLREEVL